MFNFFTKCIFCDKDISNGAKGVGEHIIPESIGGFWRIYDVCSECMLYFGNSIDSFGIKNPLLLKSMELLKLPKVDKYYNNMPYIALDKLTNEKVKMIRREGKYKTKTIVKDDKSFECSENDIETLGVKWIKENHNSNLSPNEFKIEIDKLKSAYFSSNIGDTVYSKTLGIGLKRKQTHKLEYDNERIPDITPLISKILFSAIHYFLPLQITGSLIDYWSLRDNARYAKPLRNFLINECNLRTNDTRYGFHRIRFENSGHALLSDITFFGYDNWRAYLPSNTDVKIFDENNHEVEVINLYLDFRDAKNKLKVISFIYKNKEYREIILSA